MTSEQIIRRSDILNTQVIAKDNGKRLGVINQLWVDIDRREVVAMGLRDNLIAFAGVPRYMYLNSVNQIGDVVLVDNEDVIEDIDVDVYSNVVNCEVITETGELLGRVRNFKFNAETGTLTSLIIASLGLPQIPDQVISTYEISIDEVVSSGPNRIIVFEGAEERVTQLTVGLLERLGIGKAPWEREEEEAYFTPTAKPENQLGTGVPLQAPVKPMRATQPVEQTWDEDDYEYEPIQPAPRQQQRYQQQYESIQYAEEEYEDNWSEASGSDRYSEPPRYVEPEPYKEPGYSDDYRYEDDELTQDVWDDDEPKPVNIPKKIKQPEYEEEDRY
ncbi:PRC-barrel domain-containing protein [Gloeocapsopsis crepidinum LEGE 06123]|uniref:PRC-barrel domain-containing protein n=1 Tax=Gloeocapsopsis crepidinum LEGE 06123 TaxID=588587 RepID=A0ABR9UNF2_9CHRO|nr:PRC-barrel domain-containing protein [Gloeocapsopsis crepidinum]MBE9189145.1 PRC-barrel domain-containing protein [Gloeocapsopsis crepidinum LEGE 06123]